MYKKQILKNDVRILTIPMKGTKTFTVLVMVKTGSRDETEKTSGISHFVEHMFFKGTKKRPDTLAISSALDKIGGEFNAFTSKEYTGYYAKVNGEFAGKAIDVIGDMMLNSKFDEKEIDRERGVIIEEINMYENNPLIHIDDLFEECLYGDCPAGWDTIGTKENIRNFKRADFLNYVKGRYHGKHIIIGLSGNFQKKDIELVKRLFVKMPVKGNDDVYEYGGSQKEPKIKIKKQNTQQINLSVGFRGYGYNHKDFYTLKLLGVILGGSMSSRLFISVRERKGLAYQVHTQVESYADSGYLTTNIGTSSDKVKEAIKTTLLEYKKIININVGSQELKKAKDYIKGKTVLNLEPSDDLNTWIVKQELLQKEVLDTTKLFKIIDGITSKDIRRVAREVFIKDNLNLAIIGPDFDERELKSILKF